MKKNKKCNECKREYRAKYEHELDTRACGACGMVPGAGLPFQRKLSAGEAMEMIIAKLDKVVKMPKPGVLVAGEIAYMSTNDPQEQLEITQYIEEWVLCGILSAERQIPVH